MPSSSQIISEWSRQVYGPRESPSTVPVPSTNESIPATRATQAIENMLRNQIKVIMANRMQNAITTAAKQSSDPIPQLVYMQVDGRQDGPTTQNHPTTTPIMRPHQNQPANVPSHRSSSSLYRTRSRYCSTQPTQPDADYSGYYTTNTDAQTISEGYLADEETSDKSYTVSHLDSSEVSWDCTSVSNSDDNAWIRTARTGFGLEHIERQLKVMIESYHGSVRFDCFPVRFQLLSEEQKRHNFFWRFGPQAYLDKYFQHTYVKNIWYLIGQ